MEHKEEADICLIGEGAYPYSSGGVAEWTHELIKEHKERTFHVLTLMPPHPDLTMRYSFPKNVIGHTVYVVQNLPEGASVSKTPKKTWDVIGRTIQGLISSKNFEDFGPIISFFRNHEKVLGKKILVESKDAWNWILDTYNLALPSGPFKDFFATLHVLSASFFSVLLPQLPSAKLYHALCTGYAGFLLYRVKQEKQVPCLLTEQGVYSNERRIEISMAEWIGDVSSLNLALEDKKRTLKDFWLNAFLSFAHACYVSCDEIISTFDGNQELQLEGGADPKKLHSIAHGIKTEDYAPLKEKRKPHPPTVAFIGRIVSIKDVKTFIRACQIVKRVLPQARFLALGPTNEEPEYFIECQELALFLGMEKELKFTGRVNVKEYLPEIDLVVLTSISEAQPLVVLEAGSIGIPFVSTNVGAAMQLCFGKNESPSLGQGGIVTPLANPEATANAILQLLTDQELYKNCSMAIENRIKIYYRYDKQHEAYRHFYDQYLK